MEALKAGMHLMHGDMQYAQLCAKQALTAMLCVSAQGAVPSALLKLVSRQHPMWPALGIPAEHPK